MSDVSKRLIRQRASYKAQVTRLQNNVLTFDNPNDIAMLDQIQQKLEEAYQNFATVQLEIECLEDNPEQEAVREQFERSYFQCSADIRECKRRLEPPAEVRSLSTVNTAPSPPISNHGQASIPKIKIRPFDGNYAEWKSFHDMFRDLVHNDESLPAVHKLHLLKSYLRGNASTIIESLNATEENYLVAWAQLQKRFNKPRKIIQAHIRALFEYPEVKHNCSSAMQVMVDRVEMHIDALRSLKQPVDWHEMLIYIVTAKLDKQTRTQWEHSVGKGVMPTINDLFEFLDKLAQDTDPISLVESTAANTAQDKVQKYKRKDAYKPPRQVYVSTSEFSNCPICQNKHFIQNCEQFRKLSPQLRLQEVKKAKLCFNCLKPDHLTFQCRSGNCRQCRRKHNTLLHFNGSDTSPKEEQPETSAVALVACNQSETLLSTARVIIFDRDNRERQCRVLLDPGSQSNFITERLAKTLNLKLHAINLPVTGLGEQNNNIKYHAKTRIKSRCTTFSDDVTFLVLPKITGHLPSRQVDREQVPIPKNISLADPEFYKPAAVEALLGEYLFYRLLCVGQIRLPNGRSVLQKTRLGWLVSGETTCQQMSNRRTKCFHAHPEVHADLSRFWELEECAPQVHLSAEDKLCELHYERHTGRDEQGRYIVRLPFKDQSGNLGDSYKVALKRFYAIERRLDSQEELRKQYKEFIKEYRNLGHMSPVEEEVTRDGFYLPHHAVIKTTSSTTKLRVVFDASAKSTSGVSLNDTLLVGPTIQDDIFRLVIRFRVHRFVLTADIEKMFRQIRVHEEDTNFQKILWREENTEPIRVFKLNTVTYGTASAPFLAVRTLKQLARDEGQAFPLAAAAVENDFYMDDLLTGANTLSQAVQLRDELSKLLKLGGFNLRQWASNERSLIEGFEEQFALDTIHLNASDTKKTLGICWNAKADTISYSVNTEVENKRVTKRNILSKIAQLFDPLGLLGPVIISAKFIMQELWKADLDWDESVPQRIHTVWTDYLTQLPILNNFKIQRRVLSNQPTEVQLHGFSDASEKGYGACIYIRSVDRKGTIITNLICAKSRVAPLKSTTLPRLELCAAVLLVRLYAATTNTLKIRIHKTRFWTDSTVTLHWINSAPHTLKTFVANRVAEIQTHTQPGVWSHVPTADNPADYISRGQVPAEFIKNRIWLNGPHWLGNLETTWPDNPLVRMEIPERRNNVALITQVRLEEADIFRRYSSFKKLERVIAYCLRFGYRTPQVEVRKKELSIPELRRSHEVIIRRMQAQVFASEIEQIRGGKELEKNSRLNALTPFVDAHGILRVGGRLKHSNLKYAQRHQILLPKSHPVTSLIILNEHLQSMHAGIQGTLNAVRQKYWPIDGKNMTRFIIRNCLRCFKTRPAGPPNYLMGDLPRDRLVATRPFENVGIDFCGPMFVKEKRFRNTKRIKVYVALFVCFLTKAVHLEVVEELTTEAFLASLRRFFARRGRARNIYTDNGTNFIGAKNELAELYQFLESKDANADINRYLTEQYISWHLSPPGSPHFGGLWEAAVKSFKHHLKRTVGDTLLTYEQLNTYVIEIEGILNSRPLTPLSSDPNDLQALTPAHFLIGESLTAIPENDFTEVTSNRLSLWQHIQKMKQHFWGRWRKEYLNELSIRSKWRRGEIIQLQVDDLVLLRDEAVSSMRWPIGRVTEVHPGSDGVIRVATIKTVSGTYKRSIKKLCPLPRELT